jgi:putative hydrolase of the HAD superfamily
MLPEVRAVLFDLDDTLYPHRRFVRSGFAEVARHLQRTRGLDPVAVFRRLVRASRGPSRGLELQTLESLCDREVARLVEIIRGHDPELALPAISRQVLAALRADRWRIGVLTNGAPEIQARKIRALGLVRSVDAIVYAAACGTGAGKPDPVAFAEAAARLGVAPRHIVMVGDDERCDVAGALAAGMHAVRCDAWRRGSSASAARAVVSRVKQIPEVVRVLLQEASNRHAA